MDGYIYLDNAATSFPKPEIVYSFMDNYYRKFGENPGRGGFDLCIEPGGIIEDTRKLLTDFFNGSNPNRLCFSYNCTDAFNLIINGLLKKGDHAITTTLEHNAVLRPLYHKQIYEGVNIDYIPFDEKGFVHPEDIYKKFKSNTKLVIVNHVSNVLGTVQPIGEIGKFCKENEIIFAIDASQSAGRTPIDVERQHIDIVVFTGHKSLLGPTGIGGLYVREGVKINHTRAGDTGIRSAIRTHLDDYPYRLEYGTPNIVGIAGLHAGVKWIQRKGISNIHKHEMQLTKLLQESLANVEGLTTYCQDTTDNHIGVFSFNINEMEAVNTGTMLDNDYGIACRTGLHSAPLAHNQLGTHEIQGSVRLSIGPFNTESHIQWVIKAIKQILSFKNKQIYTEKSQELVTYE